MNSIIYNIPAEQASRYRGRRVTVRGAKPAAIAELLSEELQDDVVSVQLLSANADPEELSRLAGWGRGIPFDIVLTDPGVEFPLLYNFSRLLDKHPIRASIPVKAGFAKAVRLALALKFAVKLDIGQPDAPAVDELTDVLNLYLHQPDVAQPLEYFHSVFLSFYDREPFDLWRIQEEDPEYFSFVSEDGIQTCSSRFGGVDPATADRTNGSRDCASCEFFESCRGYFKWPDSSYNCDGVRSIFSGLEAEASELRRHVASFAAWEKGAGS